MFELKGKYSTAKVCIDYVEEQCISQIYGFLNHPVFTNHIAIMPDTHAGKGSVVGFTMPMTERVIPNVIGVDIGCGVVSTNIGSALSLTLQGLDVKIRNQIPFGFNINEKSVINFEKEFPWKQANITAQKFGPGISIPHFDFLWFEKKCRTIGCDLGRAIKSICSLGGGNHFIELGLSQKNDYWLTVHTGSRNFGKCVCEYWQDIAIKKLKRNQKNDKQQQLKTLKETLSGRELFEAIKSFKNIEQETFNFPEELCYLENEDAKQYLFDMIFSQIYAQFNRRLITKKIIEILKVEVIETIESVHNFIDFEDFIIRKGSIRSYENEKMIIPFNMRDGILICTGKSNSDWNYSAPHGAGRLLSRSKAKKKLDLNLFKQQMEGVYSSSVCISTLDEAPDAYKDSKVIEKAIEPTAVIIDKIKPILNLKSK